METFARGPARRINLPPSAIKSVLPSPAIARPLGEVKLAAVPAASAHPALVDCPKYWDTVPPSGLTLYTTPLLLLTYIVLGCSASKVSITTSTGEAKEEGAVRSVIPHTAAAGGSLASPTELHSPGQLQIAGGAAPPAQKLPTGQVAPAAAVLPRPQPHPGSALHARQAEMDAAPVAGW